MRLNALIAIAALGGAAPIVAPASALPASILAADTSADVERVVWVCGPGHHCWVQHGTDLFWAPPYWPHYGWYPRLRFGARGFWHRE
jgi:hypothetical protein